MSLPTRYEHMLESVAFHVARALYKMLDTGAMEDKLVGFEVNLDAFGTYQVAFKIHKVEDDEVIQITDGELEKLDYEEVK